MSINRKFFFDRVRLILFDGSMSQSQVDGLTGILDKWEKESPNDDDRWLAYMLATAHHETGRTIQPVRETFAKTDASAIKILDKAYKAGKLPWVSNPYWRLDSSGKSWLGRGLVQITHKDNYVRLGNEISIDLTTDPGVAMDPIVAREIMFVGMRKGLFTGKKLKDYFWKAKEQWPPARRIINGIEKADLVASYGKAYYSAISYTVGP